MYDENYSHAQVVANASISICAYIVSPFPSLIGVHKQRVSNLNSFSAAVYCSEPVYEEASAHTFVGARRS